MSGYYYIEDATSETGLTPIPEDEYVNVIFEIAKEHGLKITNEMILEKINKNTKLKKNKKRIHSIL